MQFNTPLRYPGGKGKLTDFVKLLMEQNELLDGHYIEPYAGGAGVGITLLVHSYASRIYLNDLNMSVFAFWKSVIDHTEELCAAINDTEVTMEEWHKQKLIQSNPSDHSPLELGFSTFFLNRTNRSGIILGGVIGGKRQDGPWKLDARFTRADLVKRVQKIAMFGSRIRLSNQDAMQFLKGLTPDLHAKSLIYLDPPYYVKGSGLYENHYEHADHITIAKFVQSKIKTPWMVSYDYTPEIMEMYSKARALTYRISYSAQDRYKGAEAMFFSKGMIVPNVKNPSNLKAA